MAFPVMPSFSINESGHKSVEIHEIVVSIAATFGAGIAWFLKNVLARATDSFIATVERVERRHEEALKNQVATAESVGAERRSLHLALTASMNAVENMQEENEKMRDELDTIKTRIEALPCQQND